jgi:hypothetical protein
MDGLIETLRSANSTVQAIGVSVGGFVGVFATLAFFFIMIAAADRFNKD